VDVRVLHGGDPVQVDVESPAFELLDQAFEEVVGRKAVQARAGGSIPIVPELGLEGAPVILTGIGLPDDGLHSPNEKLDLSQLWSGIRIFARFFELLGATDPAVMARDEEEDAEDDEEDTGEEEPSEAAAADQAAAR
jgi:amidohydrolase